MKTVLIIWGTAIILCILEACFFAELDPESKKELKTREKIIKDEHKSTS